MVLLRSLDKLPQEVVKCESFFHGCSHESSLFHVRGLFCFSHTLILVSI